MKEKLHESQDSWPALKPHYILAFDTSHPTLSVVLYNGKTDSYEVTSLEAGRKHGEILMPEIEALLAATGITMQDINLIITTRGPGSFTGLRIGMATAKGLSTGLAIPMVSVNTLDYLAYGALQRAEEFPALLALIDGRKDRFYGTYYKEGVAVEKNFDLAAEDITTLVAKESQVAVAGPDTALFIEQATATHTIDSVQGPKFYHAKVAPNPKHLITLGLNQYKTQGPDHPSQGPLYIRKSQAQEARELQQHQAQEAREEKT